MTRSVQLSPPVLDLRTWTTDGCSGRVSASPVPSNSSSSATPLDGLGLRTVTTTLAAAIPVGVGAFGVAFPERVARIGPGLSPYAAVLAVVPLLGGLVIS